MTDKVVSSTTETKCIRKDESRDSVLLCVCTQVVLRAVVLFFFLNALGTKTWLVKQSF